MAELVVQIRNANGTIVAETYVAGESTGEVLEALRGEVESAEDGSSDWASGIDEEF